MNQSHSAHLQTARLRLHTLGPEEGQAVLDFALANREFLAPWESLRNEEYYTLATQQRMLQDLQLMQERGQAYRFWLTKHEEPGTVIGCVALSNIVHGAFQSCHLGYMLAEAELHKGYMTEAVQAAIRYAFDTLKLHRIEANIMPRNLPSLQLVRRLGFYEEGLAIRYLKIRGVWEDHLHMVLRNPALE